MEFEHNHVLNSHRKDKQYNIFIQGNSVIGQIPSDVLYQKTNERSMHTYSFKTRL